MKPFNEYAFILGTHAKLSLAELAAVLERNGIAYDSLQRREGVAFVRVNSGAAIDADALMSQLGGTIKIVEVVDSFDEDRLVEWIHERIEQGTDTKFHFGFSLYAVEQGVSVKKHWQTLHRMGLSLKKALKAEGVSCRYVQSNEIVLSSVIVHKERLLKNGVEIVLFKDTHGLTFGRTLAVQPFQDFSHRDYGRPQVDARSGMLPPKLARMMVNLSGFAQGDILLDPFCGSGTVLQEAALLGVGRMIGSDISEKAVADTAKNMEWLFEDGGVAALEEYELYVTPADALIRDTILPEGSMDRIVFEGYLGPTTPYADKLPAVLNELQTLYEKTFPVLAELLSDGGRMVAALPFWSVQQRGGKFVERHLRIDKIMEASGLRIVNEPLTYRRHTAIVGREILVLEK